MISYIITHFLQFWFSAVMTGLEMCNKYQIKNSVGQLVYFATEGLLFLTNHTSRVDDCKMIDIE